MTITAQFEKSETIKKEVNIDLPFYSRSDYGTFFYAVNPDKSLTVLSLGEKYSALQHITPKMVGSYGRELIQASESTPISQKQFIDLLEQFRQQMEQSMTA